MVMKARYLIIAVVGSVGILIGSAARISAQDFNYTARESHLIKHRDGWLRISQSGVEFNSKSGEDNRCWAYIDIELFEILSPRKIKIHTYSDRDFLPGTDLEFTYEIVNGQLSQQVRDFLRSRISRPLVTEVWKEPGTPEAVIPVKHLHRFGGCQGILRVYKDFLVFESTTEHDSRSWRWTDLQSIGKPGPYRFEVLTYEPETAGPKRSYNFELKELMPERIYDQIWARVYRPALPTDKRETIGKRPARTQPTGSQ
jgi:hypothetical protein